MTTGSRQRRTMIIDEERQRVARVPRGGWQDECSGRRSFLLAHAFGRQKKNALRDSFAKLDADGSDTSRLTRSSARPTSSTCASTSPTSRSSSSPATATATAPSSCTSSTPSCGKDRILQNTGMERSHCRARSSSRCFLWSRGHSTRTLRSRTARKSGGAREGDRRRAEEGARPARARELTESPDIVAVKRAHACAVSSRKNRSKKAREQRRSEDELPPDLRGAKQALAGQTEELAQILESFEERLAAAEKKEEVSVAELASFESMAKSLEDACATANKQRNKLDGTIQGRVLSNSKAPPRHHELPRSSSKSAFEKPRRPHGLPRCRNRARSRYCRAGRTAWRIERRSRRRSGTSLCRFAYR